MIGAIIECAIEVHRELGPGLLESMYEVALSHLLAEKGFPNERQVPIPIQFRGIKFDEGFRADLVVCDKIIVELKSKTKINAADRKQIQTHLKLTGLIPPGRSGRHPIFPDSSLLAHFCEESGGGDRRPGDE